MSVSYAAGASGTHGRTALYAQPRPVTDLGECAFYHTMDIPGHGVVEGEWDIRAGLKEYLGNVQFQGKRVLELGTASGIVCFAMERQGAEVVAFDLAPDHLWDFVPPPAEDQSNNYVGEGLAFFKRLHNSFWFGHRVFGSRAKVVYGSIYALPAEIGPVDIATYGCILLHLRDPFLALANGLRLTRETVIVTQPLHQLSWEDVLMGREGDRVQRNLGLKNPLDKPASWKGRLRQAAKKVVKRLVGYRRTMLPCSAFLGRRDIWWFFTPAALQHMIATLGFEESRVTYHSQIFKGQPHAMFTVVGRRTQPMPRRIDGPFPWY